MEKTVLLLTVLFQDPFWVGIYERTANGRYEVCKITFGAEPKDYEVYAFLMDHWQTLRFSPSVETQTVIDKKINPKRLQRQAEKSLHTGIGTKAQQALQLMREQTKIQRDISFRAQKEAEKERKFLLRQQKRKEKNKGH